MRYFLLKRLYRLKKWSNNLRIKLNGSNIISKKSSSVLVELSVKCLQISMIFANITHKFAKQIHEDK